MSSPDPLRRLAIKTIHARRLTFHDEMMLTQERDHDENQSRNLFAHDQNVPSAKASPWVKKIFHSSQSVVKDEYSSPIKSPGWQPFSSGVMRRAPRIVGLHSADHPKPI